jgi:CubicO group peptidase (beta-lactamase class C family)
VRTIYKLAIVCLAVAAMQPQVAGQGATFLLFHEYLDALRQQANIPGLSVALMSDDGIWERGLGLRDLERSLPATPDTPYPILNLTSMFGATLVLQCAERGHLRLDDDIRQWTTQVPESAATLRHVLSHSSAGTPGTSFQYDPDRFAALTAVVSDCADSPFPAALAGEILDRMGMADSVPGQDAVGDTRRYFDEDKVARYDAVLARLAVPYRVVAGRPMRGEYPPRGLNASTGLVSTVRDLARYVAALNDGLLSNESLQAAWTNAGAGLPTGLGWFVQSYNGEPVVWQFGSHPDGFSSLFLTVPRRHLTLVLLANSDGLSSSFRLNEGDVTSSLFAKLFLRLFV